MSGVRIRPLANRQAPNGAMIVLTDKARPFPAPENGQSLESVQSICATCGVKHLFKTYHIQLVGGTAIVSETIWQHLQLMVDNGGFEFVNEVLSPPNQVLTPGKIDRRHRDLLRFDPGRS